MATVFPGGTLLKAFKVDDDSFPTTVTDHTFYTVPAGRWAIVYPQLVVYTSSPSQDAGAILFGEASLDGGWGEAAGGIAGNLGNTWSRSIILDSFSTTAQAQTDLSYMIASGEVVEHKLSPLNAGIRVVMFIHEYANLA